MVQIRRFEAQRDDLHPRGIADPVLDEETAVQFAAGDESVRTRERERLPALEHPRRQRAQPGRPRERAGGRRAVGEEEFEAVGVGDEQRAFVGADAATATTSPGQNSAP